MARIIKCDICGDEVGKDNLRFISYGNYGSEVNTTSFDVCGICIKRFEGWVGMMQSTPKPTPEADRK